MNLLRDLKRQANRIYLQAMGSKSPRERTVLLKKYKQITCKYYRHKLWLESLKN